MTWMVPVVKADSSLAVDRQRRDFLGAADAADGLAGHEGGAHGRVVGAGWRACVAMRSRSEGDSMVPGQMALQRMPRATKSAATALVRPITAALDAP